MKIAVVGKGGSGKTTVSALLMSYFMEQGKAVIGIDADTNMHLWSHFWISYNPDKAISTQANKHHIKNYLRWTNTRIISADHMVKTTPPWEGSHLIKDHQDNMLHMYKAGSIGSMPLLFVGWYTPWGIGISCYHTDLSVLENILSHMVLTNTVCIVDMVASTDAFSNTLHAQFDCILLVVEPTKESTNLADLYTKLAKAAWVLDNVYILANKISDENDHAYINEHFPNTLSYLPYDTALKNAIRQEVLLYDYYKQYPEPRNAAFSLIPQLPTTSFHTKLVKLCALHKKYADLEYISWPLGDLSTQIDTAFIEFILADR